MDVSLALPCGTTVRVRNLVVFHGAHTTGLTISIQTPARAASQVQREAAEVVDLHDRMARARDVTRIEIQVCRSAASLALREVPAERFCYERRAAEWVEIPIVSW